MKSKNLKIMKENGINIPDFLIFSFDDLMKSHTALQEIIKEAKECPILELKEYSKKLCNILGEEFCPISTIELSGNAFAVRSSCNMEDGKELSFAGIFESFLDIEKADINIKVLECLQSLYQARALEYMRLKDIDLSKIKMDIIIQEMIDAEKSGILFTSNPRGILNETVITVGEGSGELVVSNQIDTSTYFYHQNDKIYYLEGEKDLLSRENLEELLQNGEKIKKIFHLDYADIEFSIQNNQIFILQARPITSIQEGERIVLDNSNIVESYPGISLPLTQSFAKKIYTAVFKGVVKRILPDKQILDSLTPVLKDMVDSLGGRMYYRIDNWYKILCFLPMSHKIIPIWQEMLGVKNTSYSQSKRRYWLKLRCGICFLREMLLLSSSMKKLENIFNKVWTEFYQEDLQNISLKDLQNIYNRIEEELLSIWDITLINDMYAFIFTGLLKAKLKKENIYTYEKREFDFIGGIINIESMKPVRAFENLARLWQKEGESKAYQFAEKEYISYFGDRMMEELKLETKTFRSHPELLREAIKQYKKIEIENPNQENPTRLENIKGWIGFYTKKARKGIAYRESSRMNRTRIFGIVRTIILEIAKRFINLEIIENIEDIFYLDMQEIFTIIEELEIKNDRNDNLKRREYKEIGLEQIRLEEIKKRIQERKQEYIEYGECNLGSRIILENEEAKRYYLRRRIPLAIEDMNTWKGTGCAGKEISGEVVIIRTLEDAKNTKGKIIVAKMTDPGWVFILNCAKGIITEKGSLLSHTAIISRELGIPAIVGVEKICSVLKDGDWVIINGSTGIIKRIVR